LSIATQQSAHRGNAFVASGITILVLVRLAVAAAVPLTVDEAYYWRWSKHLAAGYFDHPPMVAWVIRLSTLIGGDTQFGVRLVSVLLALPATWAVWRSAAILFRNDQLAATAAIFFNVTLMVAVGTLIVTPDSPLLVASAFVLLFLAKLIDSNNGVWWLAVGVAVGAGLLSKYTAFFFGVNIAVWLLVVPGLRRRLFTPWPWLGGLIAFALFTPVVLWNANHNWDSFVFQFGRVAVHQFTLRYVGEYVAAEFGLATPCIFVLGVAGLLAFLSGRWRTRREPVLLGAMVWPLAIYLAWHSLHQRVEGNWAGPIFPAFCVAAAAAVHAIEWKGYWKTLVAWSHKLAIPIGLGIAVLIDIQALFAIVPLGSADPTARALGVGWRQLGAQIETIRQTVGAQGILTTEYGLTSLLSFYLPSHAAIVQFNQQYRWANEPVPSPNFFKGSLLYVCRSAGDAANDVRDRYTTFENIASVVRQWRGITTAEYSVYRISGAIGDPLDNSTLADDLARARERSERERRLLAEGRVPPEDVFKDCLVVGTR
jgi:4-amino-4-deoxy-L-arabinose transferase-like glycosyltransferase